MSRENSLEKKSGDADMNPESATVEIDIERMRAVFGNTRELYNFLVVEHGLFLPKFPYCNLRWMILLWKGQKK